MLAKFTGLMHWLLQYVVTVMLGIPGGRAMEISSSDVPTVKIPLVNLLLHYMFKMV
jgi:hypothetical protein